jgi:hypothetical protein
MDFLKMFIARWRMLERRDIMAILLLAVFLAAAAVAVAYVGIPGNAGLGPDWDCINPGNGDPVCVRKPAPSAPPGGG